MNEKNGCWREKAIMVVEAKENEWLLKGKEMNGC